MRELCEELGCVKSKLDYRCFTFAPCFTLMTPSISRTRLHPYSQGRQPAHSIQGRKGAEEGREGKEQVIEWEEGTIRREGRKQ
jgi:hypothetical protein